MSLHSIKEMERFSNIRAHTLRIWEQRYGLLKPKRTGTNIRYYDDEQLKKLLNVCVLLKKGVKISRISKLNSAQIHDEISTLIKNVSTEDVYVETIINQCLVAAATFDEILFEKSFSNAVLRLGIHDTYVKIIYPLLVKAGLMWNNSDIMPAQEHFLSNLIKQKLNAAIDALPLAQGNPETWILFLHEEEEHEIGLLFASYLLKKNHKKVIYLGQRVPEENLHAVVKECKPSYIYTFFVKTYPKKEIAEMLNRISKKNKSTLCISGSQENLGSVKLPKNTSWVKDIESLISMIN